MTSFMNDPKAEPVKGNQYLSGQFKLSISMLKHAPITATNSVRDQLVCPRRTNDRQAKNKRNFDTRQIFSRGKNIKQH